MRGLRILVYISSLSVINVVDRDLCNLRVSYTVFASVIIHSTGILKLRCSFSITVSEHLQHSRRCVVRIPRRIIFLFLLYTYALYATVPCDSHMILTLLSDTLKLFFSLYFAYIYCVYQFVLKIILAFV